MRRQLLAWVYRHVDVALAGVGANNADYFRWCGRSERVIRLVPHAVDTARFAADAQRHEAQARQWRRECGIADTARALVFAGKLIPKKDPMGLLRAFAGAVAADDEQLHLVFVGAGALKEALQAQAAGRRNVHFRPFQNQQSMPAVYRLGDVYVLPSLGPGETWGLAMNEAMASGSLVIASDRVGGARDVVEHGRTGWIFPAGNHAALVRHIKTLKTLDAAQGPVADEGCCSRAQSTLVDRIGCRGPEIRGSGRCKGAMSDWILKHRAALFIVASVAALIVMGAGAASHGIAAGRLVYAWLLLQVCLAPILLMRSFRRLTPRRRCSCCFTSPASRAWTPRRY